MRILSVLTYYRPYVSGLTIYTERLAKALAKRGHSVTILTSQFNRQLPREEFSDSVHIVRAPVWFRLSKGVIMPSIGLLATKLALKHDVIHLHLPQFDAAGVALRGRLLNKPTVLTYHCDLKLPPGIFNLVANQVVHVMNHLAAYSAHIIVTYTQDYAKNSPYTQRYMHKVRTILPPVEVAQASKEAVSEFAKVNNPGGLHPVIGMAARFAAEKGVEILLEALPKVMATYPSAMIMYAGQYQDVLGEEEYAQRLMPVIQEYQKRGQWAFLGVLKPSQMAAFYSNLNVLVVPSLNSTESFGLVQIEAMLNGTPVVASDLPGVRQPVKLTGMGKISAVADASSLAEGILSVLKEPNLTKVDSLNIRRLFDPDVVAAAYEELYLSLLASRAK